MRNMIKNILLQAVKDDFLQLAKLAKGREIYGCTLVTGSDFGNVAMKIAAYTKRNREPNWYADEWELDSSDLPSSALSEVDKKITARLIEKQECLKRDMLPLFVGALQELKNFLVGQEIADAGQICFFVSVIDDDGSVEAQTAQELNSNAIFQAFSSR